MTIWVVLSVVTMVVVKMTRPPVPLKPTGLMAMELFENRELERLYADTEIRYDRSEIPVEDPVDPNAPIPRNSRMYNNLLDNLLNSLHWYFRVEEGADPFYLVTSWDTETGYGVLGYDLLVSLETNISYLLTLKMYREMHVKAIFDEDLEFGRNQVDRIFAKDWQSIAEWPLGPYFDLVALWELTGEEKYLEYAERYAAGADGSSGRTPLDLAGELARKHQFGLARIASPFHYYNAALLADYGSRHDPAMVEQARSLFVGLNEMLFDRRFNLLYKQVTVSRPGSGSLNIIQTYDTLEQIGAIRGILEYHKASSDPEAVSLAREVMDGVWGFDSPLLLPAPEPNPPSTFYGIYTGYDHAREAKRNDPTERTLVQILLYQAVIQLNSATLGEFRDDIDFLGAWLENLGPLYQTEYNGYLSTYEEDWQLPDEKWVSATCAIWMARSLAEDEWYRYQRAHAFTRSLVEGAGIDSPGND